MKRIAAYLVGSLFSLIALAIASCAPSATTTSPASTVPTSSTVAPTKPLSTTSTVAKKSPVYGGTFTQMVSPRQDGFDPFLMSHTQCAQVYICNEELLTGDWSKGPEGTGESDMLLSFGGRMDLMKGWLSESWDLPDPETMVFHIRKGVHWWNKPPTNGREVVADDVVWTINKAFKSPKCYFYTNFVPQGYAPTSVKALDKYTVEVKVPAFARGMMLLEIGDRLYIFPPEPTQTYGDMSDWRNAIGTGAWMLTDHVAGSSQTYTRNPNYWQNDPNYPQNRLPYPDRLVALQIDDASTQQAAFRTGKLDKMSLNWEDFQAMQKARPEVQYVRTYPDMPPVLTLRVDKAELPFKDIRVRRALNLAVNKQEIIDTFYKGHADLLGYPCPNVKSFSTLYVPLEKQPATVQELFKYNPQKAKELLAEAGYPNGFKMTVHVSNTGDGVDYLSIMREYFLKVGVDLQIKPMESGALTTTVNAKLYDALYTTLKTSVPFMLLEVQEGRLDNKSMWTDTRVVQTYRAISDAMGKSDAEVARLMREINPFLLDSAWGVWLPIPHSYSVWWSWVANYHGEQDVGYCSQNRQVTFVSVDTQLKRSMGY